jgi:hypothetical protein
MIHLARDVIFRSESGPEAKIPSRRVAQPFGFALTDPSVRLSRTRLFPRVDLRLVRSDS